MAKYSEIKKRNTISKTGSPWKWRWQSFKNFFYDKWMRLRGYTPTMFEPYTNKYRYIKRSELEKQLTMMEKDPVHEVVGFKKKDLDTPIGWYHSSESKRLLEVEHGKQDVLEALRQGEKSDYIVRRSL